MKQKALLSYKKKALKIFIFGLQIEVPQFQQPNKSEW